MSEELKPCPFCGGEAEIERCGTVKQSQIINCADCGCTHESGDIYLQHGARDWNQRHDEMPDKYLATQSNLDRLIAELEGLYSYDGVYGSRVVDLIDIESVLDKYKGGE